MNKVDGVQKMPDIELKKKRDIILGMIGENITSPKPVNKKIDGIFFEKKPVLVQATNEAVAEAQKKHNEEQKKKWQEEFRKNNLSGPDVLPRLLPEKKNNFDKKVIPEIKKTEKKIIKKISKPKEVKKIGTQTILKKNNLFRKDKIVFIKIGDVAKFISEYGKKFFSLDLKKSKAALKNSSFILMATALSIIIIYFSLFLLITVQRVDNKFFRFIEKYFPVPALLTNYEFVDIYDYIDLENKIGDSNEAKFQLIKKIISENLYEKYKTNDLLALDKYAISDKKMNSASLGRISKMKAMIDRGDDFDQIAGKYGDERKTIIITNDSFAKYDYGEEIKKLNEGEVSEIVYTENGYYIYKCYQKNELEMSFGYIFVQPKSFTEYVDETARNIYYVSFVD